MTDAQRPVRLSGPTRSNSSAKEAVEALPEKGRVKSSGKSSAGTPSALKSGESRRESRSTAPEAFSIDTPTIKAQRVGKSLIEVCKPWLAPFKKESKRFFLLKKKRTPTAPKMSGIGSAEIRSIIFFLKHVCAKNAHACAKTRSKAVKKQRILSM